MMSDLNLSPLMRQYRDIKQGYPDAILFFRVGDFYEMFYEDAQVASRILSIALTSRDKNSADPVPLCGVPFHAATGYIARLLKAGRIVALCEQVEDPKAAKGLVRREVVRLYTPGTLVDTEFLSPGEFNYLMSLAIRSDSSRGFIIGLATLEVSTGEFWVMETVPKQFTNSGMSSRGRTLENCCFLTILIAKASAGLTRSSGLGCASVPLAHLTHNMPRVCYTSISAWNLLKVSAVNICLQASVQLERCWNTSVRPSRRFH
jgi:hypothetical protein